MRPTVILQEVEYRSVYTSLIGRLRERDLTDRSFRIIKIDIELMRLKTFLPIMAATGVLMCGPTVFLHAGQSDFTSPETTGWFRKKKKSDAKDSIPSRSAYEKLTGDGAVVRKGMFNVYQKKMIITSRFLRICWGAICWW